MKNRVNTVVMSVSADNKMKTKENGTMDMNDRTGTLVVALGLRNGRAVVGETRSLDEEFIALARMDPISGSFGAPLCLYPKRMVEEIVVAPVLEDDERMARAVHGAGATIWDTEELVQFQEWWESHGPRAWRNND